MAGLDAKTQCACREVFQGSLFSGKRVVVYISCFLPVGEFPLVGGGRVFKGQHGESSTFSVIAVSFFWMPGEVQVRFWPYTFVVHEG